MIELILHTLGIMSLVFAGTFLEKRRFLPYICFCILGVILILVWHEYPALSKWYESYKKIESLK